MRRSIIRYMTIAAGAYPDVFGVFLKHRNAVTRVTFWGLSDAAPAQPRARELSAALGPPASAEAGVHRAALPAAWPDGRVTGLRARGGFEVDVTWKNGALERTIVRSLLGQPVRLRRGNTVRSFDRTSSGATLTLLGEDLRQNPQR